MSRIQTVRDDLAAALALADLNAYSTTPPASELPAIVVGLPETVDPTITVGYWQIELPVYVVVSDNDTADAEHELLDIIEDLVPALKAVVGTTFRACRVVDIDSFFNVTVGTASALSASVNVSIMST